MLFVDVAIEIRIISNIVHHQGRTFSECSACNTFVRRKSNFLEVLSRLADGSEKFELIVFFVKHENRTFLTQELRSNNTHDGVEEFMQTSCIGEGWAYCLVEVEPAYLLALLFMGDGIIQQISYKGAKPAWPILFIKQRLDCVWFCNQGNSTDGVLFGGQDRSKYHLFERRIVSSII